MWLEKKGVEKSMVQKEQIMKLLGAEALPLFIICRCLRRKKTNAQSVLKKNQELDGVVSHIVYALTIATLQTSHAGFSALIVIQDLANLAIRSNDYNARLIISKDMALTNG